MTTRKTAPNGTPQASANGAGLVDTVTKVRKTPNPGGDTRLMAELVNGFLYPSGHGFKWRPLPIEYFALDIADPEEADAARSAYNVGKAHKDAIVNQSVEIEGVTLSPRQLAHVWTLAQKIDDEYRAA